MIPTWLVVCSTNGIVMREFQTIDTSICFRTRESLVGGYQIISVVVLSRMHVERQKGVFIEFPCCEEDDESEDKYARRT